jgi:hypothetical protein
MQARAIGRMSHLANHVLRVVVGLVGMEVPPGLVGNPHPSHGTKMLEM